MCVYIISIVIEVVYVFQIHIKIQKKHQLKG